MPKISFENDEKINTKRIGESPSVQHKKVLKFEVIFNNSLENKPHFPGSSLQLISFFNKIHPGDLFGSFSLLI